MGLRYACFRQTGDRWRIKTGVHNRTAFELKPDRQRQKKAQTLPIDGTSGRRFGKKGMMWIRRRQFPQTKRIADGVELMIAETAERAAVLYHGPHRAHARNLSGPAVDEIAHKDGPASFRMAPDPMVFTITENIKEAKEQLKMTMNIADDIVRGLGLGTHLLLAFNAQNFLLRRKL